MRYFPIRTKCGGVTFCTKNWHITKSLKYCFTKKEEKAEQLDALHLKKNISFVI